MFDILAENPLVLLFSIIGLGYLIGNISLGGFKLGVAAVLFVGIALGALDPRLGLPDHIYVIGLVLFVYSVGLQAGPGFFASFNRRGLRLSLLVVVVLAAGAALTAGLALLLGVSGPSMAGLYCGALTNTPALAAVVETTQNLSANLPAETRELYLSSPVVTYGLAYPFGVFGVILWIFLCRRCFKVDPAREEFMEQQETPRVVIYSRTFRVTNPAVAGKTAEEVLRPLKGIGFVLSRIRKGDKTDIVEGGTRLDAGDLVVAVGDEQAMQRAGLLLGETAAEHLPEGLDGVHYRNIYVSRREVVGKTIRDLHLHEQMHATVTRIRRGDVQIIPTPDTVVEMGDRLRVITRDENVERIARYFGNSIKSLSETDYLSLSLGIVLGVFLGMIPIPLGGGLNFKLGFAGGPLIAGLVLGRLGKTGPVIWELPYSAVLVLRQVGLVFFLAAIGSKAGFGLGETLQNGGIMLLLAGALITTTITVATLTIGYKYLKLPMAAVTGIVSGVQTQPAVLAYASQQTESDLPNVWYANVYPTAMVAKIILAQVLVSVLLAM